MGEYYGVDFGGTNLRIGKVNPETGQIVGSVLKRSLDDVLDNETLNNIIWSQLFGKKLNIGICAAGTVDEKNLIITMSPNSKIKGEIDFGRYLREKGNNVVMTNDMKGAVCGEATFGQGRDYENVLVATYSSGYNCAVARKRKVMTTAEFGHVYYPENNDMKCGCGGKYHLETAVSGNGAAQRAKDALDKKNGGNKILHFALDDYNKKVCEEGRQMHELNEMVIGVDTLSKVRDSITAKHVYQAFVAQPCEEPQKTIRDNQVKAIAVSFGMMNSAYNPLDIMVLMGSQTNDWHLLFDPAIKMYQKEKFQLPSLPFPKIVRTELPEIGVQGAVAYLLSQGKD